MIFRPIISHSIRTAVFFGILAVFGVFGVLFFRMGVAGNNEARESVSAVMDSASSFHPAMPFDKNFVIATGSTGAEHDPQGVSGGVVPHHLLAHSLIAHFFQRLAKSDVRPETIVLIGPNHFSRGDKNVLTGIRGWDTPFGRVEADSAMARSLVGNGFSGIDEDAIEGDHAIYGIVPFIRYYLPETRVVPLLLGSRISKAETDMVSDQLSALINGGRVSLIASTDFSHYLSSLESQKMDQETIRAIANRDYRQIETYGNDHIDSPASLIAVMKAYEKSGWNPMRLLEHTDSGKIQQKPNMENTSYFTFGFSKKNETGKANEPATILFGGDMSFDRSIRTAMRRRGNDFPLAGLKEVFSQSDLVVANLEGPITDNATKSEGSVIGSRENYFFTFDPSVAKTLKDSGVGMVNLGNNHILNFGEDGVAQTKKYLESAGVGYFGSPLIGDIRYGIRDIRGQKIAFVNYNQFIANGKERAMTDIAEAKAKSDFVVLYAHWGKEYVSALPSVRELAHTFVDAGADLVIGSHPHVVQEHEVYHGKTIYYSLGNLVFDQYFQKETKRGLLVRVIIDAKTKEANTEEIPVELQLDGQTVLGGTGH